MVQPLKGSPLSSGFRTVAVGDVGLGARKLPRRWESCEMPGGGRCPDCGSADLVDDAHYSQSQLVCSDCGCVVTEGVLTTTFSDEGNLRGTCAVLSRGVGRAWDSGGTE